MTLKEKREDSIIPSLISAELHCIANRVINYLDHNGKLVIRIDGIIDMHSEGGISDKELLANCEFTCRIFNEELEKEIFDDEGCKIISQLSYSPADEEFNAFVEFFIAYEDRAFQEAKELLALAIKNPSTVLRLHIKSNTSFTENINSSEDLYGREIPINEIHLNLFYEM